MKVETQESGPHDQNRTLEDLISLYRRGSLEPSADAIGCLVGLTMIMELFR